MSTIGSSALATFQARRFSARTQMNMRKRGAMPSNNAAAAVAAAANTAFSSGTGSTAASSTSGGRVNLYKQMYGPGAKNGVRIIDEYGEHHEMRSLTIVLGIQHQ